VTILVPEQFGFWKGTFTEGVAYKLTNNLLTQKMNVEVIFCDLAKAFDCKS
jgi:hypothetical protein